MVTHNRLCKWVIPSTGSTTTCCLCKLSFLLYRYLRNISVSDIKYNFLFCLFETSCCIKILSCRINSAWYLTIFGRVCKSKCSSTNTETFSLCIRNLKSSSKVTNTICNHLGSISLVSTSLS